MYILTNLLHRVDEGKERWKEWSVFHLQPQLRVSRLEVEKPVYPHSLHGGLSTIKLQLAAYNHAIKQMKCGSCLRESVIGKRSKLVKTLRLLWAVVKYGNHIHIQKGPHGLLNNGVMVFDFRKCFNIIMSPLPICSNNDKKLMHTHTHMHTIFSSFVYSCVGDFYYLFFMDTHINASQWSSHDLPVICVYIYKHTYMHTYIHKLDSSELLYVHLSKSLSPSAFVCGKYWTYVWPGALAEWSHVFGWSEQQVRGAVSSWCKLPPHCYCIEPHLFALLT